MRRQPLIKPLPISSPRQPPERPPGPSRGPNQALRYPADSSYWRYLVHRPIDFLAQVIVRERELHRSIKIVLILGTTLPLILPSYHDLVR